MKGGEHLETAGKIDLVAFDKTGTLTQGETTVASVDGIGRPAAEVLRVAATAEKKSEHHLASAIFDAARGGWNGQHVRAREAAGETAVHVTVDGEVVGVIGLQDELREAAPGVVASLQDAGVRTVMLTGDNERTARAVAESVGIDEYAAELLPEDKQERIRQYREDGHVVAMVGDGINDAPSLATADVGIAMGAAGTDTAIETADMALMADDLERIPYAVTLSKATRRNILENVAIAIGTVTLLLAGVLTNSVHLAGGMLVHEGSVLLVILNGMRLLRY